MSAETTSGASSVPYTNIFLTTMLLAMFACLLAGLQVMFNPQFSPTLRTQTHLIRSFGNLILGTSLKSFDIDFFLLKLDKSVQGFSIHMTPQKNHFMYPLIFFKLLKHPFCMFVKRKRFDAQAQCLSKQMTKNSFLLQLLKVTQ